MGEILVTCPKCGKEEWHEWGTENRIEGKLCKDCYSKWGKFFQKNSCRLKVEYPKEVNPTWLAFINQLPKEKVTFT